MSNLEEVEAIKQLKYKYFRCLDTKQWDEIEECFAEDARGMYRGNQEHEGREAIMGHLKKSLGRKNILTMHQVHHPEITLGEDDTASGIWALEDRVIDLQFNITVWGAAICRDEYVKLQGKWKIKSSGFERLFEEMESRADKPGLKLTLSMFDGAPSR